MSVHVDLRVSDGSKMGRIEATRVLFSAHQCFSAPEDGDAVACLKALGRHLCAQPGLALQGSGALLEGLLRQEPDLARHVKALVVDRANPQPVPPELAHLPAVEMSGLPAEIATVFLCETRAFPRLQARKAMKPGIAVLDADVLVDIAPDVIPARAWTAIPRHIYPIDIPEIRFRDGLDLLLIDCPARNLALMPNGLAYVHNALKKTAVDFQTFDLDIVTYHRYHVRRLFDEGGTIVMPSGREMPVDPWQAEHYDLWVNPEVIAYLMPVIEEAAAEIIRARPKMLGLSIQQCNEAFSRELVKRVKAALPDTVILVGGFSCYNADIGLRAFPEADYMCVGEADLTVGPLVEALARGERPRNLPGVLSRHDTPGRFFAPAPMPHNLDQIEFPKYEWCDLSLYRNYNGYQLVPIIASRGCRWSRCTFCAERFYWRIRSAKNFVEEMRWLVDQGCTLFMFNESDLNGMPDKLLEICDEIIASGLKVKLTGQLRINKHSDRAFFDKLRAAGFVALRFGIDAFSENTLRLQKKGYTTAMVSQNLKDCWEAGIYTEVNWVIGVPGETEGDCDEGIELILKNRQYIGRLANINPLVLVNGGVYWIDPEAHNIHFRTPREELYAKFPRGLPADEWYSTEPYIDAHVRKKRFQRIVTSLHDAGFPVGSWANRVIEDVRLARDRNRAGGTTPEPAAAAAPKQAKPVNTQKAALPAAPPRLIRATDTHGLVAYGGKFYAVPNSLGPVDLSSVDPSSVPGIITEDSEEALVSALQSTMDWANSRGHFDDQKRQRERGSLYRVNSALGEAEAQRAAPAKPRIVKYDGKLYALANDALAKLDSDIAAAPTRKTEVQGLHAHRRRIARLLPHAWVEALRTLWQQEQWRRYLSEGKALPQAPQSTATVLKDVWNAWWRALARKRPAQRSPSQRAATPIAGTGFSIIHCVSQNAVPELLTSYGDYNVVEFDGLYYAVRRGIPVNWESGQAAQQDGVVTAKTAKDIFRRLREEFGVIDASAGGSAPSSHGMGPTSDTSRTPKLLGTVENYNLVAYEGFIYGLPHSLGAIDLSETDVLGMTGVIRDVSYDVVEGEIRERAAKLQPAAA